MALSDFKLGKGMTSKDAEFFYRIGTNLTDKNAVNWDKVASDLGLKDSNIAKVRFRQIQQKLKKAEAASGGRATGLGGHANCSPDAGGDVGGDADTTSPVKAPGSAVRGSRVRKPRTRKDSSVPVTPRRPKAATSLAAAAEKQLEDDGAGGFGGVKTEDDGAAFGGDENSGMSYDA